MPDYLIRVSGNTDPLPDTLIPSTFSSLLQAHWPGIETHLTRDPRNPWSLEWTSTIEGESLVGQLGRTNNYLAVSGLIETVAAFAVWYRALLPATWRVVLFENLPDGRWLVDLLPATDVASARAEIAKRSQPARKKAIPAWQTAPGGYLGNLSLKWGNGVFALHHTPDDELWALLVSVGRSRLFVYRGGNWEYTPAGKAAYDARFRAFAWWRGRLWASGGPGSLLVRDRERWETVAVRGLRGEGVPIVGADGSLWLANSPGTLLRSTDGTSWVSIALPDTDCFATLLDPATDGSLWIATEPNTPGGPQLYRWYEGDWTALATPDTRRKFYVASLLVDRANNLWVGVFGDGVWRWDGAEWRRFSYSLTGARPGLPGNDPFAFVLDTSDQLWAATGAGVGRFDGRVWRWTFPIPEEPGAERILSLWKGSPTALHADRHGRLWIGGRRGEVAWIDTPLPRYANPNDYTLVDFEPPVIALPS